MVIMCLKMSTLHCCHLTGMMENDKISKAIHFAKEYLQITHDLKEKQKECITKVLSGEDSLAVLPTGYGKSLIYMVLPVCQDYYYNKDVGTHIVIVVSPLVALMEEQMTKMNAYGINAVYIGSTDVEEGMTIILSMYKMYF